MLTHFTKRFLSQLPRNSFLVKEFFRLSEILFSFSPFRLPDTNESSLVTHFQQSKLNAEIIPYSTHTIWPFWVNKILNPESKEYNTQGILPLLSNSDHRSWTTIGFPFSKTKCIIDPTGLLTSEEKKWSLDIWINHKDKLTSFSHLSPYQTFNIKNGHLTTTTNITDINISSQVLLHQITDTFEMIINNITVLNTSSTRQSFSLYLAVRPYTYEGVSPISSITYHSSGAFIIDNKLSIIFNNTPQNIVCSNYKDGDISEHIKHWEMILKTDCKKHQASAFVQYDLALNPGESKVISCKIPATYGKALLKGFSTALSPKKNSHLTELIQRLKEKSVTSLSDQALYKDVFTAIPQLTTTKQQLDSLVQTSIYHLLCLVRKTNLVTQTQHLNIKELFDVYSTLCLLGKTTQVKAALTQFTLKQLHGIVKLSQDTIFTFTSVIRLTHLCYKYDQDSNFLSAMAPLLEKSYYVLKAHILPKHSSQHIPGLLKPTSIFNNLTKKESLIISHFYVLHALECLKEISTLLSREQLAQEIAFTSENLTINLNLFLKSYSNKHTSGPRIPVSTETRNDYRLVNHLELISMGFLQKDDPKIQEIVSWLETHFCTDTLLYNPIYPCGFPIADNMKITAYYLQTLNSKAFSIIDFVTKHAISSHALPDSIHPKTFFGSQGNGHSPQATATFIQTILSMFLKINSDGFHITPFLPEDWYTSEKSGIGLSNIYTPFGVYSFTIKQKENAFILRQSTTFQKKPPKIFISFPKEITEIKYKSKTKTVQSKTCRLDYIESEIIFYTHHAKQK